MSEAKNPINDALQLQHYEAIRKLLDQVIQQGGQELIETLMEEVQKYYQSDRCYVFEEDPTGKFIVNTYELCAPGVTAEKDNLQEVPAAIMASWLVEFEKRGTFYISCDDEYAKEEPFIYEVLEPQNIHSIMAAPMMEAGKQIGFLGIDNPKKNQSQLLYLTIAATSIYHELRSIKEKEREEEYLLEREETTNLVSALSAVYVDVVSADLDRGIAKPVKIDDLGSKLDKGYFAAKEHPYSMKAYIDAYVYPEDKERLKPIETLENAREFFSKNNSFSVDFRSSAMESDHYVQIQVVKPNPDINEIVIGFKNIDEEETKRLEQIRDERETLGVIEALSYEYQALYLVNANQNTYRTIRTNEAGEYALAEHENDAEGALFKYVEAFVAEEDKEKMKKASTLSNMDSYVPEKGIYSEDFKRIDGEGFLYFQMNVARFKAEQGDAYFVIGFRNITSMIEKEIKTQQALKDAYDVADAANRAKSDFLQTMSHDIRTPMNGIIGMTAIAAAHLDDKERVGDSLKKITQASRHLLSLINEVLDMSKIESGKVSLVEEEFNLSDLIDNLLAMVRPQIQERKHELMVNIKNVKHELVIGDSLHIQQVFVNLMSNAVKYTPDGGKINLDIQEIPCNQEKVACYEFVFKDNGIGMSEEYQKHIFEPFTRAEDGRISKVQGTGLGMPITKNIVNMMGGDIKVESKLDEGSTFTVTIFLKVADADKKAHEKFALLSVLVADDDEMSMESAVEILEELGMKSEGVLSGEEAVEKVKIHREEKDDYNAVVLDWKMPGMDGVETARAIRREVGEEVPIIILTAYDWTEVEEEARSAGVNAFVSKPLFKSRFERVFNELIGEEDKETNEKSPLEALDNLDLSAYRCLLVEDNELNAEIAIEILEETGLKVEHVWDGAEAVEAVTGAEDGWYDLVLMDIQMPKMNGNDATRAIRASERKYCKTVPIVAMTANAFAEDVQAARTAGMNEHIAKPIDLNVLAKVLDKWVLKR